MCSSIFRQKHRLNPLFSPGYPYILWLKIDLFFITFSLVGKFISAWDYLPEWIPLPGPNDSGILELLNCFFPYVICILGLPLLLIIFFSFLARFVALARSITTKSFDRTKVYGFGLLSITLLLYILCSLSFTDLLISYALRRYDTVIAAIEQHRLDHGIYPPNLDTLSPQYLASSPGIYMKYGDRLIYSPTDLAWDDHAPFRFELHGTYNLFHGRRLKYCPDSIDSCYESGTDRYVERINQNWIWVYSSGL